MPRDVAPRTLPADPTEAMHAVTKQYCDRHSAGILWEEATTEGGRTKNSYTNSGYNRITTRITVPVPLKIQYFTLDLPGEGEYALYLDSMYGWAGVDDIFHLRTIAEEIIVDAEEAAATFGANHRVDPEGGPFILTPGVYYVALERVDPSTGHFDVVEGRWSVPYERAYGIGASLFGVEDWGCWLDDQERESLMLPMRITAYKGTWTL